MSLDMVEDKFFTTQFGEKIKLIPGYGEKTGFNNKPGLKGKKLDEIIKHVGYDEGSKISIKTNNFGRDVITYALLMDYLDDLSLLPKDGYERGIDIGGREGIHAALFRAHHAKHMISADLMDGSDPELTNKMKKILANQRKHQIGEYFLNGNILTAPVLKKIFPGKQSRRFMTMCGEVPSKKHFYDFNLKRDPAVDEFVVGDILKQESRKVDIALCFLALCLIDYRQLILKVADMLPSGGVFAFFERYTWGPGPMTGLTGDFPYFEKRLTLEDIKRYYSEYKPDESEYVEKLYNLHDPRRTSLQQYIDLSYKAGMHLVGFKPMLVPFLSDTVDESYKKGDPINRDVNANEVLRDIHHFRPDIEKLDLFTSYFMMVFKKA